MWIASIPVNLLGILVFLFIFWKRLKEDYSPEIIFRSAFNILIGVGILYLIALKFLPVGSFWLSSIGAVLGLALSMFTLRVKFYETFEAMVISVFPWIGLIFLLDSVFHASLSSFLAFIAILIFVFLSYYLDSHYKEFAWYKSGKIGFAGVATLGVFFVARAMLAIFKIPMLSFIVFKVEAAISGVAALTCFILLFYLAKAEK